MALAFVVFVVLLVRPVAGWLTRRYENKPVTPTMLAWVLVAVLLSALTTEWIGIHALFGAFLLGAVIPHGSRLAQDVHSKLHDVVTVLLLPAFFAYTGMRTEIGLLVGVEEWGLVGLIILTATLGKFGGTMAASRLIGLEWRMSASLGVLMNMRG